MSEALIYPVEQFAYQLRGLTYLPHYERNFYVSPGYGRSHLIGFSETELKMAKATKLVVPLWPRPKFKRES